MQLLESVFANYLQTKADLQGKATFLGNPDQISLKEQIPKHLKRLLEDGGRRLTDFKVQGSFGNGVIAGVPWVAVFNKQVTESAQNGYYIVLLFSEDMKSCYLSFNQGITEFESQYSRKLAQEKVREAASRALSCLTPHPDAILGAINLSATGHLGHGYEAGAIESFRYERADPSTEDVFADHFKVLLSHYDILVPLAKKTLQSLAPVTEAQYQQTVLDKAQRNPSRRTPQADESPGGVPVPNKRQGIGGGSYVRNPNIAAAALEAAAFKCEINNAHQTFVSSAKDLPFVEAHHLVPMSQQGSYDFSLDVTANIVALCPLCHKLLHHAKPKAKKASLLAMLAERHIRLNEKGIDVTADALLGYYNKDLMEDEV